MQTQIKKSGTKTWQKVTGTTQELKQISQAVHQPIKPANGKNPTHIDIPIKK